MGQTHFVSNHRQSCKKCDENLFTNSSKNNSNSIHLKKRNIKHNRKLDHKLNTVLKSKLKSVPHKNVKNKNANDKNSNSSDENDIDKFTDTSILISSTSLTDTCSSVSRASLDTLVNTKIKTDVSPIRLLINLSQHSQLVSNLFVPGRLASIKHELELIDSLVGLEKIKDFLADEIRLILTIPPQNYADHMFNFIISGPIGSGKSYLGKLIARILFKCLIRDNDPLNNMLIINKNHILPAHPVEIVSKTKQILKNSKVLLMDNWDNYSNDDSTENICHCIDTVSTEGSNVICVITTNINPEILLSTPTTKYYFRNIIVIPQYSEGEILEIFLKKLYPHECSKNAQNVFLEHFIYIENCCDIDLLCTYTKSMLVKRHINARILSNNNCPSISKINSSEENVINEDDILLAFSKLRDFKNNNFRQ